MIDWRSPLARTWYAVTALAAGVGLVMQAFVTAAHEGGHFTSTPARVLNLLFFFTIESNVLVLLTHAVLAAAPRVLPAWFAVVRLAGLVAISLTGVVYHAVLKDLLDLSGAAKASDVLLHTVSPLLTVVGWLASGPRGQATVPRALRAAVFPVAYLVVTLARGPLTGDWYPYPFLDVQDHGYARVLANAVVVAVVFFALAGAYAALDRGLDRALAGRAAPRDRFEGRRTGRREG
ncbi:hypothetical protein EV189_1507 [Motilibacter rhizosphaerae]|uniref:FAR-17a/AIG1-like protein n=1 Tax=Motilibacter rhizosphaerae TaxID=598652 RepID=A0A4Q7NS27_9ACTN|nr:Pr6Pr family membrane protein [Motilibacter rhizosphaerae]RZS89734.1 hypothetical protein EV189_1507 [Motilibacter rhizosphaerae]